MSGTTRRMMTDVTGTLATRFLTIGFGLCTGIITARALGPENRGIFSLAALFPASVVTLSKLGQGVAAVYFVRREKEDVARVASNVLMIALVTGAVLVGSAFLLKSWLLSTILRGVPFWALVVVLPMIPVLLVESSLYGILQATNRFKVYNARLIADSLLTLSGMIIVLLVLHLGLIGALCVVVTERIVMTTWLTLTVHREFPMRLRFERGLFRRMMRYGMKTHMQQIAAHFHFRADMYLVAYYLDPKQVAFYSIAVRMAELMMNFPQTLGMVMFPQLAGSDLARGHAMTAVACRQTLAMTLACAVVLISFGKVLLVLWYGSAYAPAAAPLAYVAGGIISMSLYVLLSRNFTSRNRQFVNVFAAYLALGGNLALNVVLIPRQGIVGAALATLVSYTMATAILFVLFLRESKMPWHEVLILKPADVALWKRMAEHAWEGVRRRIPARA